MIFKIKYTFLSTILIFLQSCSGGRIGDFLEASFENLENVDKQEQPEIILEDRKVFNQEKKESNNKNIKEIKKQKKPEIILEDRKVFNQEKKESNNKNIKEIKKQKKPEITLEKNKLLKLERKDKNIKQTARGNKSSKKRKNELQSYKIIFILKEVDPKDPIEQLSTILRDSEVNFEIEKIERFLDPIKKTNKKD